jgi:hypothetical protein
VAAVTEYLLSADVLSPPLKTRDGNPGAPGAPDALGQ